MGIAMEITDAKRLNILKYPHPTLKVEAYPILKITTSVIELIGQMSKLMTEHKGVGLAANQVGVPVRVFVSRIPGGDYKAFINPEIIERSDRFSTKKEGCLSHPGLQVAVTRPTAVTMKAMNMKGDEVVVKAHGLEARVWQHEIDHLNGINITKYAAKKKYKTQKRR